MGGCSQKDSRKNQQIQVSRGAPPKATPGAGLICAQGSPSHGWAESGGSHELHHLHPHPWQLLGMA